MGVVDAVAVTHTRPVGAMRDEALRARVLAVELTDGWAPLIDRDPRVAGWIEAFQRGTAPSPPYPTEGTPTVEDARAVAR